MNKRSIAVVIATVGLTTLATTGLSSVGSNQAARNIPCTVQKVTAKDTKVNVNPIHIVSKNAKLNDKLHKQLNEKVIKVRQITKQNTKAENNNTQYREYKIPLEAKYQQFVHDQCKKYSIQPELIYSLCFEESRFKQYAKSEVSALGLMQVKEQTSQAMLKHMKKYDYKQWLDATNGYSLYDKKTNLRMGIYLLHYLVEKYRDLYLGIMAYNYGEGTMLTLKRQGIYITKYIRNLNADILLLKNTNTINERR